VCTLRRRYVSYESFAWFGTAATRAFCPVATSSHKYDPPSCRTASPKPDTSAARPLVLPPWSNRESSFLWLLWIKYRPASPRAGTRPSS